MKVAVLGPIAWRTPPVHYGPWETIAGLLADGLAARGVDVTLFATLDSSTSATLDGVCPHGYEEDPELDGRIWEALHVAHALSRSGDFDLVHNNVDWLPLAFSGLASAPILTTVHGFSDRGILPAYQHSRSTFVSISDSDRAPELSYAATIHHGIDLEQFPFSESGSDTLVSFGRIHPDKGTAEAIAIARRCRRPLVICGIVQDERYFREEVEPEIDGDQIRYLGAVGGRNRSDVLGKATALLHPIAFEEPFGLSVVEAMACGTPVVAYSRGSMSEIVDDGVTGFLVEAGDQDAAAAAVDRCPSLDRRRIRACAEERFSASRMVDDYLKVYRQVLNGD